MKNDNAFSLVSTHYRPLSRSHSLRSPPSRCQGFLLRPSFFLLRVFYRSLIFLIIVVGLSSYWLPLISGYKQLIETEASSYLGTQVKIGNISYDSKSQKPRWVLTDVSLKNYHDKKKSLTIKKLSMTLDMVESLRTIRIQPDEIEASGVDVTLTQDEKGKFDVNGLKLPIAGFSSGAGRQKPLYVDVTDGTLHWLNNVNAKQLDLYNLSFHGAITADHITANIQAEPPESVGKPLKITANLTPDFVSGDKQQSEYWNGIVNVKGEINEPSALPIDIKKFTGIIDGDLAFQLDAKIKHNRPVTLKGQLIVGQPVLEQALHATQSIENAYNKDLKKLAINGEWQAGDEEWKADFSLQVEQGESQQISNLSFAHRTMTNGFTLDAKVDQIDLNQYLPLLERQQWLNTKIGKSLTELKPRGQLTNFALFLDVDMNDALRTKLQGKGIITDASIQAHGKIPAIENISARFNFDKNSGSIKVDTENSQVDYSRWFETPINIKKLGALISWKRTAEQWNFSLQNFLFNNEDAHLNGAGTLKIAKDNTPFIDLVLDFGGNQKIQGIKKYVPAFMPSGARKWLKNSIKTGVVPKGGMILKGNLHKFPFEKADGGEFFTWFEVKEGKLEYLKNWPDASDVAGKVIFTNEGMVADITSAIVSGNKFTSGHIVIPNFKKNAELIISDLHTTGKLSKQVDYLRHSPIGQSVKGFLNNSKFSGKSDLKIAIQTPLGKNKLKKENVAINGVIDFHKVNADFSSVKQSFKQIQGRANFDQHGFSSKKMTAEYKKSPISIAITTAKNKKTITATLKQSNDIKRLTDDSINALKPYLKGSTSYTATLQLPSYSLKYPSKEKLIDLQITSNLKNIESRLPAPFNKSANALVPLSINLKSLLDKKKDNTYQINYGNVLSAIYQYDSQRLGVSLGDDKNPELPKQGILLRGSIPKANLMQWGDFIATQNTTSGKMPPFDVNIQIKQLFLNTELQGEADLKIHNKNNRLTADLKSNRVKAYVMKENNFWNIKLANLNTDTLSSSKKSQAAQHLLPKNVPSLHLQCENCRSKGQLLDKLVLQLSNKGDTSLINLLDISGKDYQLSAIGKWANTGADTSYTQLDIKQATLDKPGDFINRMGGDIGLKGGKTKLTGKLGWQGSPIDFDLASLSGDAHITMQKGQLMDVKSGAGKLLGLLNFSKLGRRLRFDFSDVSAKGLLFDQISGNIQLKNGLLSTQDTIIESQIVLAGIKGTSNLIKKTHNQEITVIPDIKSALPTVGLLLGGVGLAAVVAALDKLSDKNQTDQLKDETIGTRYQVTGTWAKPSIKNVTPVGAPEDIYNGI